ncbi:MAG: hypothetical protein ABI456_01830, partial [Ktedonobacteraceae bacterium]
ARYSLGHRLRGGEIMADEQTKTQELLAILNTRSWTKAERTSARQQINLYYERKLASLQTALFEAIAVDAPKKVTPFEIDEYIHRYHKRVASSSNCSSVSSIFKS